MHPFVLEVKIAIASFSLITTWAMTREPIGKFWWFRNCHHFVHPHHYLHPAITITISWRWWRRWYGGQDVLAWTTGWGGKKTTATEQRPQQQHRWRIQAPIGNSKGRDGFSRALLSEDSALLRRVARLISRCAIMKLIILMIDKMVSLIEQHYEWQGKSFILDISTLNRVFFNRSTKAFGVPTWLSNHIIEVAWWPDLHNYVFNVDYVVMWSVPW